MRTWERGILIGYGMIREIDGTNQGPDWGNQVHTYLYPLKSEAGIPSPERAFLLGF